jgi:hypothetical protein
MDNKKKYGNYSTKIIMPIIPPLINIYKFTIKRDYTKIFMC